MQILCQYCNLLSETVAVVGMTVAIGVDMLEADDITDAAIGRMDAIARVSVVLLRTGCTERMWGCWDAIGRMFAFRGAGCWSVTASDALKWSVIQTHKSKGIVNHVPQDSVGGRGGHLPLQGLEPIGGEPLMSVMHSQCDARPTVTFPAIQHHRPLAGNKLYCLMTEARVLITCLGSHSAAGQLGFKPTTYWTQVQHPTAMPTSTHYDKCQYNAGNLSAESTGISSLWA